MILAAETSTSMGAESAAVIVLIALILIFAGTRGGRGR